MKNALIIGGAVVGVYILYKLTQAPSATPSRSSSANPYTVGGSLIAGLVGAFEAFNTPSVSGGNSYGPNVWGNGPVSVPPSPTPSWADQGIDPNTGGVKLDPGETYGPPAPTSTFDDNGLVYA